MYRLRILQAITSLIFLVIATATAADPQPRVVVLSVDGAIGPASSDYVRREFDNAHSDGASLVVLHMDTPGGLDTAMRDIIQAIIASPVPVVGYVAPSGARAASAGTYILYATHIAAMAPATTLGAATPVRIGGAPQRPQSPFPGFGEEQQPQSEDEPADADAPTDTKKSKPSGDAMEKKIVNDAAAYIRGLAQMRGRNADWAEQAVRDAASLSAEEALELDVIDLIAANVDELLARLDGRSINVLGQERTLQTSDAEIVWVQPDWRSRLLSVITDPNILPILMTLGMLGLIYEMLNPGFVLPGVLGGICLLLALYAAQVLPVNYAGLALILLGIAFMVGEAFMPSFGVLGIGGAIAFVIGSIILIDTEVEGFGVSIPVIVTVGVINALLVVGILTMAVRARHRPVVSGVEELVGSVGEILVFGTDGGWVRIHSEDWAARARVPLKTGDKVRVTAVEGLTLVVEPEGNMLEVSS